MTETGMRMALRTGVIRRGNGMCEARVGNAIALDWGTYGCHVVQSAYVPLHPERANPLNFGRF